MKIVSFGLASDINKDMRQGCQDAFLDNWLCDTIDVTGIGENQFLSEIAIGFCPIILLKKTTKNRI
jgi:hypothetical protein